MLLQRDKKTTEEASFTFLCLPMLGGGVLYNYWNPILAYALSTADESSYQDRSTSNRIGTRFSHVRQHMVSIQQTESKHFHPPKTSAVPSIAIHPEAARNLSVYLV